MKLQYKAAGLMIFIGVFVLLLLTIFYSRQNRQVLLKKELQNIQSISEEIAHHMDSHLKANAAIAGTLSSAEIIRNALLKSNSEFDTLSETDRRNKIKGRNRQWEAAKDINDSLIQKYLTNSTAEFLKQQQIILPGFYGEIFLTNRYGVMIASTGKLTTLAHAHKYWWKASYHDGVGRVFFDDRGFDSSVEGYVIGVVVPVKSGNEIIGILKCNINIMGPITDIIEEFELRNPGQIKIVRTKGLVVSEKGKIPLSYSLPENFIQHIQAKKVGSKLLEGKIKNELIAFSPVNVTLGSEKYGFGGSYESVDHIEGNKGEAWHIFITLDEDTFVKEANNTTRLLIMVGFIFVTVTSLIALFLGKWIANPLVMLADATQKISEGHLDTRIGVVSKDEIGILAKAFNNMMENLENTLTSRDNLAKEIELRKKAEDALQKAYDGLETKVEERSSELVITNKQLLTEIDDRKSAEKRLRGSEERFKKGILHAPYQVMIHAEGKILQLSESWTEITGYTIEDIPTIEEWTKRAYTDINLKSKMMSHISKLYDLVENEKIHEGESSIKTKSGEIRIWDFSTASLGVLPDGKRASISMAIDVTDRKQLEELLRQTQKMESLGTLAGGIAHDFNTLIGTILGYTEVISDDISKDSPIQEDLKAVAKVANRAKTLVKQIRDFSQPKSIEKKPIDIILTVRNSIDFVKTLMPKTIKIVEKYGIKEQIINANEDQINQVLVNLCTNAGDFMENHQGTLEIALEKISTKEATIPIFDIKPGEYIKLSISDNGYGIEADVIDRVFDPYFTTKAFGKGSGLGLSVVHGIVKSHQGHVLVDSRLGKGTTFTILLPTIK
jgi:PAS domain S-box-containing protein